MAEIRLPDTEGRRVDRRLMVALAIAMLVIFVQPNPTATAPAATVLRAVMAQDGRSPKKMCAR